MMQLIRARLLRAQELVAVRTVQPDLKNKTN